MERSEKILALLLMAHMGKATMQDKALQLNIAGFSNIEIADLLSTSPASIATLLSAAKKDKVKKRSKRTD